MPFLSPVSEHRREIISQSMDLLTPSSLGSIPTLSLTTKGSRSPWGEGCQGSCQPSDSSNYWKNRPIKQNLKVLMQRIQFVRRQWGRSLVGRCVCVWTSLSRCSSSASSLCRRISQDQSTSRCYAGRSRATAASRCQAQTSRPSNLTLPRTCSGDCSAAHRLFHLHHNVDQLDCIK